MEWAKVDAASLQVSGGALSPGRTVSDSSEVDPQVINYG